MSGSVLPNPECIPGSTYYCPLSSVGLPDIKNDRSLSVLYFFPKQLTPHRSVMLPGARRPQRILSSADLEVTRNGGRGRGRGGWDRGGGNMGRGNGMDRSRNDPFHSRQNNYGSGQAYGNGRGGGGGNRGGYGSNFDNRSGYNNSYQHSQPPSRAPYQPQAPSNSYGNSGGYDGRGGGYGNGPSYPRGNSNGYQPYNTNSRGGYNAPPPPQNSYSSYGNDMNAGNAYSGYGGYGGYGGYDSGNNFAPPSRGVHYNGQPSRGRGRGW